MLKRVWEFVRIGVGGIVVAYQVLGYGIAAEIAMLRATMRARRERRARRPEHLADRMDRAWRNAHLEGPVVAADGFSCGYCGVDVRKLGSHYHCPKCGRECSVMGHREGQCRVPSPVAPTSTEPAEPSS